MELYPSDPHIDGLPPADIRLLDLEADPDPDGKHLRVKLNITPFQQKPYIDLILADSTGRTVATTSVVEPVMTKIELTLHIRKFPAETNTGYTLTASLSYPDLGEIDHRVLSIELHSYTQKKK